MSTGFIKSSAFSHSQLVLSYLFSRVLVFFYLHLCFILWQIPSYRHNSYYFSGFLSFACKFFYYIGILKTLWCFQATNVYKLSFIATTHKHTRTHKYPQHSTTNQNSSMFSNQFRRESSSFHRLISP